MATKKELQEEIEELQYEVYCAEEDNDALREEIAERGREIKSLKSRLETYEDNTQAILHVIEFCRQSGSVPSLDTLEAAAAGRPLEMLMSELQKT